MKTFASDALAAIVAGTAIVGGAAAIIPRDPLLDPIRVWSGFGVLTIDSEDYLPLGGRGFAQQTSGAIGGIAQGMTLTLSGVEAAALALLDADQAQGSSVVVTRLIFAGDGKTLLDAQIFDRGRGDTIDSQETVGGPAAINFAVESTARGLGRSLARTRADYDQRLINSADGYFKHTAFAPEKSLYWGGKKPDRVGTAIGSTAAPVFS